MKEKQVKLSRMFKGGRFAGYCLSVDGEMLSHQTDIKIETTAPQHSSSVSFLWHSSVVDDAPDIHLE
ncbi:hypothetical protein [Morganella morganii]|uniref:hypothetical protein n=1 Tax=Morganella morganii TaxID=582 RepID=UPI00339D0D91